MFVLNSLQKINWEDLAAKKVPAPFKPVIRDELDVSNFAEEFTEMDPTYSPAALPQNCDRIFQVGGCFLFFVVTLSFKILLLTDRHSGHSHLHQTLLFCPCLSGCLVAGMLSPVGE